MSRNKELAELTAKKEELMKEDESVVKKIRSTEDKREKSELLKKDSVLIKRIRSINQQIDGILLGGLEEDLIQAENNALCDD